MARRSADSVTNGQVTLSRRSDAFLAGLADATRITFVSHVQPDPDSLGSMLGLAHLVETCLGKPTRLTRDGLISRAENRAMVQFLEIDLLPEKDLTRLLRQCRAAGSRSEARTIAGRLLPKRLADRWFEIHALSKPLAMLGDREIEDMAAGLHRWRVTQAGSEGYEKKADGLGERESPSGSRERVVDRYGLDPVP